MSQPKIVREARERLREVEAEIATMQAELAAADAAVVPAKKRHDAVQARRRKQLIVVNSAGDVQQGTMAGLYVEGYGGRELADKKPREVVEAIDTGAVKVACAFTFGASYTAKGLAQRIRIPTPEAIKAAKAAARKLERTRAALEAAKAEDKAARLAMFDTGEKLDRAAIVDSLATELRARLARDKLDNHHQLRHSVERLQADDEWGPLAQAKLHLHHALEKAGGNEADACPCQRCQQERREAREANAEAERIAALPTAMFTCPVCKRRHRGSHDVQAMYGYQLSDKLAELLDADAPGWREATEDPERRNTHLINRIYCAKGRTWFLWTTEIKRRIEAAAKKAARTPRVEWTCPNPDCAEDVITAKPGPDDELVECPVCGIEANIPSLVMRRYVDKKAA